MGRACLGLLALTVTVVCILRAMTRNPGDAAQTIRTADSRRLLVCSAWQQWKNAEEAKHGRLRPFKCGPGAAPTPPPKPKQPPPKRPPPKPKPAQAPAPKLWPRVIPAHSKNHVEFGFLHLPKTGGTAIKDHMLNHRAECSNLVFTATHAETERMWQAKGFHTIVVLRHPADRFRSAFDYAAGGSEKYTKTDMQQEAATFESADAFADALREGDGQLGPRHRVNLAWQILLHRERGVQFRPASFWVDGDPAKRHPVCYSLHLATDISRAVNAHTPALAPNADSTAALGGCAIKAGERNVSKRRSKGLNAANTAWVENYYRNDLELFKRHCSNLP